MSEKMACPGCGAHLSGVLRAYEAGSPCPECGLSASAASEILRIRSSRADEALRSDLAEALKGRDAAERKARSLDYRLSELRRVVAEALAAPDPEWLHDGFHDGPFEYSAEEGSRS